jgi:alanine dehydrogenase
VGVQLGEVLGERHGQVLVLGDGVVGSHAAKSAHGLGARVQVAGLFAENGARLKQEIGADLEFFLSTPEAVASRVREADLVIGGVLSRGAKAEYVVTEDMIRTMRPGSVVVDVSIDQGGCIETSRPTSHGDPVFPLHGVTHYCVTNMPGAYPKTSTLALVRASLPYVLKLAESGLDACRHDPGFAKAVNTHQGFLTCAAVAEALNCQDQLKEFV